MSRPKRITEKIEELSGEQEEEESEELGYVEKNHADLLPTDSEKSVAEELSDASGSTVEELANSDKSIEELSDSTISDVADYYQKELPPKFSERFASQREYDERKAVKDIQKFL